MFDRYAAFLLKHRLWFVVVALAIAGWLATPLIPVDQIRFDFSFKRLFRFEGHEAAELTHFKNLFGDDAGAAGVLFVAGDSVAGRPAALSPDVAHAMVRLHDWLDQRDELDAGFTASPVTATDFFAEPVRSQALRRALAQAPSDAEAVREASHAWHTGEPLPPAWQEYEEVAVRIARHDLYQGMLLSQDGTAAALLFRFDTAHNHPTSRRDFLAGFEERVDLEKAHLGDTFSLHRFGIPVVTEEYTRLSISDILRTAPASIAVMALFLFLLFRSVSAMLLPQAVVMVAVICAIGFMQMTNEPLNIISHVVPVIVLVVGVADAVHIISRYSEERAAGLAAQPAIRRTVSMLSKACFLTSATTAIGFASLGTATIATIASFGIYAAAAVMFTYVVNMTLLPIGLSAVSARTKEAATRSRVLEALDHLALFAARHARAIFASGLVLSIGATVVVILGLEVDSHLLEEVPPSNPVYQATKTMEERLSPVIPYEVLVEGRQYEGVTCRTADDCREALPDSPVPANLTCVTAGRTRKALAPARDAFRPLLEADGMRFFDRLQARLDAHLPERGGHCVESVKDPALLQALDAVRADLLNSPEVTEHLGRVESLAEVVKQMHQAILRGREGSARVPEDRAAVSQLLLPIESANQELLDRFATLDYDATRLTLYLRDHGSNAWYQVRDALEAAMAKHVEADPTLEPRFSWLITGTMTFVEKALSFIVHDMLLSISTAFFFIFLLMVVLFRSLRIGLLSILPNIFPLLATLLLMTVADIELRTATIIIFSISLGIAVNDTIHFIARYNEELERGATREAAIVAAMRSAGRAMITTTLILTGGFLVDLISEFVALQQFGYLASFTLAVALLADLLILPACLILFDSKRG